VDDRIKLLEREIAHYRGLLRKGVLAPQADAYLRRIREAEDELQRLQRGQGVTSGEAIKDLEQRVQALRSMAKRSQAPREAQLFEQLADFYAGEIARLKRQGQN
jgi:hypothetical protein